MKSEFLTELVIQPLEDEGLWVVREPLIYRSHIYGGIITVHAGFYTDLASVPRVPFVYEAWGGKAHREAVVHDYLFQRHLVSKHKADRIFLEAMKVRKKPLWVRYGLYFGVVLGGQSSYNSGPDRYKVPDKKYWPSLSDNNPPSVKEG